MVLGAVDSLPVAPAGGPILLTAKVETGRPGLDIAPSFIGFSTEYGGGSVEHYFYRRLYETIGSVPKPNPVVVQLFKNLTVLQGPPVLRVGGNSTDQMWWTRHPFASTPPQGASIAITPAWLKATRAFVDTTHTPLILGINLAVNQPQLGAAWAKAAWAELGGHRIQAFEIGNEPNYFAKHGLRSAPFGFAQYLQQFKAYVYALRAWHSKVPLAGPATSAASPHYLSLNSWAQYLPEFLRAMSPHLTMVTYHRYPLNRCHVDPGSARYPTVGELLSPAASAQLGQEAEQYVRDAKPYHVPVRVSEINSIACGGAPGLSNSAASALWATDTLFYLAQAGISGVNFQVGGYRSTYAPFRVVQVGVERENVEVYPLYYGLLLFAQAASHQARILPTIGHGLAEVKLWATRDARGTVHVVVINQSASRAGHAAIQIPGAGNPATLVYLHSQGLTATTGMTLAGQTYATQSGKPQGPYTAYRVQDRAGYYEFAVPAAGAALLTVPG